MPGKQKSVAIAAAGLVVILAIVLAVARGRRALSTSPECPEKDEIGRKVWELKYDPKLMARWVHSEIAAESYQGFLRGPLGTLRARAGNDSDRALLLKWMIERTGKRCRFVRGGVWGVELEGKPGEWVYLGPSLDADPGARPEDRIPIEECHTVDISLVGQTAGGEVKLAGKTLATALLEAQQYQVRFRPFADRSIPVLVSVWDGGLVQEIAGAGQGAVEAVTAEDLQRLVLVMRVAGPGAAPREFRRELFTREYPEFPARFRPDNVWSVFITTGWIPESARQPDIDLTSGWADAVSALHRRIAFNFLVRSDAFATGLLRNSNVIARFVSPRLTVVSSGAEGVSLDLLKNDLFASGPPASRIEFAALRSCYDASLSSAALEEATGRPAISAATLLANAWERRGEMLSERLPVLRGALERLAAEGREGATLGVSAGRTSLVFRKKGEGVERAGAGEPLRTRQDIEIGAREAEASISAAADGRPWAPRVWEFAEPQPPRWFLDARLFYLAGAESRLDFEKQITETDKGLEFLATDYYDDVKKEWRDRPTQGTIFISKDDIEGAGTYTNWFFGPEDRAVGRTWDMLSRKAYRELMEQGWTRLMYFGSDKKTIGPFKFYLMHRWKASLPVNNHPLEVPVLQVWGDRESEKPLKPAAGTNWKELKDPAGIRFNWPVFLDDPEYPISIPLEGFVQSRIPGSVTDAETGRPVAEAAVTVVEPKVSSVSWPGGGFVLPFFRMTFREFTVTAEAPGYRPFSQTIDFRDSKAFPLRIAMQAEWRDDAFVWMTAANAEEVPAGAGWDGHARRAVLEALARPSVAVVVPRFSVAGPFAPAGAWLEVDVATGEIRACFADGVCGATTALGLVRGPATGPAALPADVLEFFTIRVPAWNLSGGTTPFFLVYLAIHDAALGDFASLAQMLDGGVFIVPGNPALADPLLVRGVHEAAGRARVIRPSVRGK